MPKLQETTQTNGSNDTQKKNQISHKCIFNKISIKAFFVKNMRKITISLIAAFFLVLVCCFVYYTTSHKTLSTNKTVRPNMTTSENNSRRNQQNTIVEPEDKEVSYSIGSISIKTWNPVTISTLENSTNLYFTAKNQSSTPLTLRLTSLNEIQNSKPNWIFQFAGLFNDSTDYKLGAGETKTLEFYLSKDIPDGEKKAQLPFRFQIVETGDKVNIPIDIVGRSSPEPIQQYVSTTIEGHITTPNGKPLADVEVIAYFLNIDNEMRGKTDVSGNFSIGVPTMDDLKKMLGNRHLPYPTLSYFLVAEKEGYTFGYRDNITPSAAATTKVNLTLKPIDKNISYSQIGELKTDGPYGYWWVKFIENNTRVVAVQGQHPPNLESPGHVVMLDLTGKELWRFPTDSACWGFDVSPDSSLIAVGCKTGSIYMLDTEGHLVWKKDMGAEVNGVRFSPDGKYLAGGRPGQTALFNPKTGEEIWTRKVDTQNIRWSPDGQRIVASDSHMTMLSKDGDVLWNAWIGEYPLYLQVDSNYNVYASGKTREMYAYDSKGNLRWRYRLAQTTNNTTRAMSEDGKLIVAHTFSGLLQAFNDSGKTEWERPIYIGEQNRTGPGHQGIDMTPDGKLILVGDRDYGLTLLDRSGTLLWRTKSSPRSDFKYDIDVHGHQTGTISVVTTNDGEYIAAGYADSVIRIFKRSSK
jgi:outer membrane protein assembly factor BamB